MAHKLSWILLILGDLVKPGLKHNSSLWFSRTLLMVSGICWDLGVQAFLCQSACVFVLCQYRRYPAPWLIYMHTHKHTAHINTHTYAQQTFLCLATPLNILGIMGGFVLNSIQFSAIWVALSPSSLFLLNWQLYYFYISLRTFLSTSRSLGISLSTLNHLSKGCVFFFFSLNKYICFLKRNSDGNY